MAEEEATDAKPGKHRAIATGPDTLSFAPAIARKLGLSAGANLDIVIERGRIAIRPNIHSLARVYVEASSRCNLSCRTCIRQTWSEPQGDMALPVFRKLVGDLRRFPHLESVMLGGFGEPTLHPDVLTMVSGLKALPIELEMVTNGTLLDDRMIEGLLKGGLDRLWISFDGADDTSYENIREGARFENVVQNLKRLREMNRKSARKIAVGIAFVVTRENIADLKDLGRLARRFGADRILVSNVIPYGPDMEPQMVCNQALTFGTFADLPVKTKMDLPRLDIDETTKEPLWRLLAGPESLSLMGEKVGARVDECRFIRERCVCIRWDGEVSPCMGLMHAHKTYFQKYEKKVRSHSFGGISQKSLWDIWKADDYVAFRERVAAFDFSPCHICGGCHLVEDNAEDCTGNTFPATCGGCLWAQGIIQCP
ncbi:MAG: radical SAM protein [Elusimicrobia bacterium]|nr:radical SAM protein [Elusimicrobiota bacterium]